MSKYADAKPEAWYFQCEACGKRGCYVGTYEGVKRRLHPCQRLGQQHGTIRITGRRQ